MSRFLCALLWLVASPLLADTVYDITGEAYDQATPATLVYREKYTPMDKQQRVEVHYFSPEGELIAHKTLDFSPGLATPSYELVDRRDNSANGARLQDGKIAVFTRDAGGEDTATLAVRDHQAIDAGFAAMVVRHWDSLLAGEQRQMHFAFAARLRNVSLTLRRESASQTPIHQPDKDYDYFSMTVSNSLLALFADPVHLAFDADRRLRIYHGRSNLSDAEGERQDVVIYYQYHSAIDAEAVE